MNQLCSYTLDQLDDIRAFPHSSAPAILIDFEELNTTQESLSSLVRALPSDYTLHVVGTRAGEPLIHYQRQCDIVLSDLQRHVGDMDVLRNLDAEIRRSLELFHGVTKDSYPMISLRVVTDVYVKRESPSVSDKYHRDSTSLTLTKCFFGSGVIYTDEANVRRDFFRCHSIASSDEDAVLDTMIEYEVPDEMWVLLKGEIWCGIDSRSQALIDYILGPLARRDVFRGQAFIHKGGYLRKSPRRLVFNINSWKTDFQAPSR